MMAVILIIRYRDYRIALRDSVVFGPHVYAQLDMER
jgi:hypothetical protein